ncbi:MAG: glutamine-hydrolyzing GMP synthase [Clostridia bacterium]|nr:glutamine-hydrolyzing GMP synthase [Clostridia bacterium]
MEKTIKNKVLILNFGGQYNMLIARRVRENNVYCELLPFDTTIDKIKKFDPSAIIFTGGPNSVYEENSPKPDDEVFSLGVPILGICYGCQLIAQHFGGKVESVSATFNREYGKTQAFFDAENELFYGLPEKSVTWMSHGDEITALPDGFTAIAHSKHCPYAAIYDKERNIYGVQFHPEVTHTVFGKEILKNFLFNVARLSPDWTMGGFVEKAVKEIREKVGDGKVLLALSGGVDSSVAAALIGEAIGKNLTCVFVDHGLMRQNEGDEIEKAFSGRGINFIRINAEDRFLSALKGVTEPEKKRKIIGEQFIRVFEEVGKTIGRVDFLAQGTIYPDVIESGNKVAETIKSHHNVGGLPSVIGFKEIIEPLRLLFKDEVRALGRELKLPEYMVNRQPFPGPGLAIRVIGEITKEKLEILRKADAIFREEIEKAKLKGVSQYFAALTNMRSVGVMGDGRTYEYAVALRSVSTEDFMTCVRTKIPYRVLDKVSSRIVNEVKGVNRVLYDVTGKPPATVEYE